MTKPEAIRNALEWNSLISESELEVASGFPASAESLRNQASEIEVLLEKEGYKAVELVDEFKRSLK